MSDDTPDTSAIDDLGGILGDTGLLSTESVDALGPSPAAAAAPAGASPSIIDVPGWTVLQLQQDLNQLGASPKLATDGIPGPKTTAALKSFQTSRGLTADGILGPLTEAQITEALGGGVVPPAPSPSPIVPPSPLPSPAPKPAPVKPAATSSSSSTWKWLLGGAAALGLGGVALFKHHMRA